MHKDVPEESSAKGHYTITKARLETPQEFKMHEEIKILLRLIQMLEPGVKAFPESNGKTIKKVRDDVNLLIRMLNDSCARDGRSVIYEVDNIVPTAGRANIANNMTNALPTYSILINKFAIGSGTNAPANGDTQLQTETYRNNIASITNGANVAYATGFLNATEFNGTIREAGIFSGGTGAANSGALMSRVALNITKSNTETLTIDWTFTLT